MAWLRAFALALALSPGAGCSLLLGFHDAVVDASPDASLFDGRADAGDDPYETDVAGDSFPGVPLAPGQYHLSNFPAGDHDFFSFMATGPADTTLTITFSNAEGDLDLKLYNSTMTPVMTSASDSSDTEMIMLSGLAPDTYTFEIYAGARGPTIYVLDFALTVMPPIDAAASDAGP